MTSLTLRLYARLRRRSGCCCSRPSAGPEVARVYRDVLEAGPDELGGGLIYITGPEGEDFVPTELVNQLTCAVVVAYAGPEDEARRAVAELLDLGPAGQMMAEMSYAELNCALDDPPGTQLLVGRAPGRVPGPGGRRFLCASQRHDGAVGIAACPLSDGRRRLRGPTDYPIPWRRSNWVVHPFGLWTDPADDERAIRWTRDVRADVHPWATGAVYLNFIGHEGTERVVAGWARTTTTDWPPSRPSTTRTTCSTSTTTLFPSTRPAGV